MDSYEQLCRAAVSVALEPHKYKWCVGCERVVPTQFEVCECGSYNFSKDVKTQLFSVIEESRLLLEACKKMINENQIYESKSTKNN